MNSIKIKNARVNNLKGVDVEIPLHKITAFIGPSGSGKTSLAFHTLYSESKRRFLNSFPTYLKFFSERPAPVDVDKIEPVLPVFGLPQINPIVGTRSTVGDIMQITRQLQTLYSTYSAHYCPIHQEQLVSFDFDIFLQKNFEVKDDNEIFYLFIEKEKFLEYFGHLPLPNRTLKSDKSKVPESFDKDHQYWEILRFKWKSVGKLHKKMESYLKKNLPIYLLRESEKKIRTLQINKSLFCPQCEYMQEKKISPSYFSPYNALGACQECNGFGNRLVYDPQKYLNMGESISEGGVKILDSNRFSQQKKDFLSVCKQEKVSLSKPVGDLGEEFFTLLHEGKGKWKGVNKLFKYLESKKYKAPVRIYIRKIQKAETCFLCEGSRINSAVHNFSLSSDKNYFYKNLWEYSLKNLLELFKSLDGGLDRFFKKTVKNIISSLDLACAIGLGHLEINRKSKSLSSGEYQRLLLLKYLSYEGTGGLFIFDEPSLGLDDKECAKLHKGFQKLISQDNTIVLIEHNDFLITKSDYVIEMGPGAGKFGGEIVSQTANFISAKEAFSIDPLKRPTKEELIHLRGPKMYGKTFKDLTIGKNQLTVIYGPSGSGKTSVVVNNLAAGILERLGTLDGSLELGEFDGLDYPGEFDDVLVVDANLNRYSSRSTVGSLTGLVSMVRRHFLRLKESKAMGLKDGNFSANSVLGQCPECEGSGVKVVEMQFLEDVILTCEDCDGKKIKPIYADMTDGEMSYYQAVSSPLNETLDRVDLTPKFKKIWEFMKLLNLDYLSLDRTIKSLSGGEKQRIYLLSKLSFNMANTLLVFENISFGLSKLEQYKLCLFLQKLALKNTVVVIDQSKIFQQGATQVIKY